MYSKVKKKINLNTVQLFIFDFDGVLTDNFVYINSDGQELVKCSRADGLAFNFLKKNKIRVIILSTEKNRVVSKRAKKLRVECIQGVENKLKKIMEICSKSNISYKNTCYVGNDLNDYYAMLKCEYRICPSDAHKKIKNISNIKLKTKGGEGVAREIIEDICRIKLLETMI